MVVVCRKAEKNDSSFQHFFQRLQQKIKEADPAHKASPKLIYFNEIGRDFMNGESALVKFENYLSKALPNIIIIPNDYEVFTTELINQLNTRSAFYKISTFGLYQGAFSSLSLENLFNVNLELFGDLEEYPFVDYQDSTVQIFCTAYRTSWNTDPSRYSFQGFDLTYFLGSALLNFGRNLTASVPCWSEVLNQHGFQTPFRFYSAGNGNGYENIALPVIRYGRDDLIRKRVN
jgi:hypothetical protein